MREPGEGHVEVPSVRTGQGSVKLAFAEFRRRYLLQFDHPKFEALDSELEKIVDMAWSIYQAGDKAPRTRAAGPDFADPAHELDVEWLATRARIHAAQMEFEDAAQRTRILLITASPRTDETCPAEMAKSFRLAQHARKTLESEDCRVDFLDLSELSAAYGRKIHPCKACVSTSMPLCHWPCSCYPNHYNGQTQDWMNELYPRWVAAHGIMIITPVHWYQAPSGLKLMIDRLVCADGGNPDPTTTSGKDPAKAKAMEMQGWHYPKHLKGRVFSIVVHGDTEGAGTLRRNLHDWLTGMDLISAGAGAVFERYIGYFEEYARSHDALDKDPAIQQETANAALALARAAAEMRSGRQPPDAGLPAPRIK